MDRLDLVYTVVGFFGAFFFKEMWSVIRKHKEDGYTEVRTEIKDATKAIVGLTVQLQGFQTELRHLAEKVTVIPEMQRDLNALGAKVRLMDKKEG